MSGAFISRSASTDAVWIIQPGDSHVRLWSPVDGSVLRSIDLTGHIGASNSDDPTGVGGVVGVFESEGEGVVWIAERMRSGRAGVPPPESEVDFSEMGAIARIRLHAFEIPTGAKVAEHDIPGFVVVADNHGGLLMYSEDAGGVGTVMRLAPRLEPS